MNTRTLIWAGLAAFALLPVAARAQDLDDEMQKAIEGSMKKVAPTVVKIVTSGGTEVVRTGIGPRARVMRRGSGPTTGLVVSADGYVISSAFNFANKPTNILVIFPGGKERRVARVVATDETRMLTLLQLQGVPAGTKYPIPTPVKKGDITVGATAMALGRTLSGDADELPSVSVGIVSAIDRIWGRAVQTDAKASPTNYGGPLVDLEGNVFGVMVPASPQAEGELAGFEWYDSGIGFAIPLEDINGALPRLKKGTPANPVVLKRGIMGVTMKGGAELFAVNCTIGTIAPGSPAEKYKLQPGDVIKELDGKPVKNFAKMRTVLGTKYEGDSIKVVIERKVDGATKDITIEKFVLGGEEAAFKQPFLGILPMRDDPDAGVEVRYVYPKSPAEVAKIEVGDRIMKAQNPAAPPAGPLMAITKGRDELASLLATGRPNQDIKLEIKRKKGGKTETITVRLGEVPETVPASLPDKASAEKALTPPGTKPPAKPPEKKKIETGTIKKALPASGRNYWVYIPDEYNPNISCSVVVWLHPIGKHKESDIEDFVAIWQTYCDDHKCILVCPVTANSRGWTKAEADYVKQTVRSVMAEYTVDQKRIVAHGLGVGGEMAFYLGFQARDLIRGVATVGAHMAGKPRERLVNQPLSLYITVGAKDPVLPGVKGTLEALTKFKFPAIMKTVENMGHQYLDSKQGEPTLRELERWIDSLDRI
jgi:S1-C subfamily serine protease